MPVALQAGMILQATHACLLGEQIGINQLHYVVSSLGGAGATDYDAAGKLGELAAPVYKAYLPVVAEYRGLRLQVIHPNPFPHMFDVSDAGDGLSAGEPLPPQTAAILTRYTANAGRSFRGRVYLPFWTEGDNDNLGRPSAATITKINNWRNAVLVRTVVGDATNNAVLDPVIWSRKNKVGTLQAGVSIRNAWATQRRRAFVNRGDYTPF